MSVLSVGVIGASHWHLANYLEPLLAMPDVRIVAVSDPDVAVAKQLGERLDCDSSTEFQDVCDRTRPDFVFALGRHCDMAAQGAYLVERDIAFAMEKPCGLDGREVARLAGLVADRHAFAAVPLVWRQSGFMDLLGEAVAGDRHEYLALRIVSGHPDRYVQAGCAWMLDPMLSGGGSTINLGVHLVDLFRVLTGASKVDVRSAHMSHAAFGLPVEDWSVVVLGSGASSAVVDTGYLYPAPTGRYEVRFSIKTDRHYILADAESTEILDLAGGRVTATTPAVNSPTYGVFVRDIIDRFRRGAEPVAGMADIAATMAVVDRAYELAGSVDAVRARAAAGTGPADSRR